MKSVTGDSYQHWEMGPISEFKKLSRKQRNLEQAFSALKKLLQSQFHPIKPQPVIAPGKIHHVTTDDSGWELWKVEMMVKKPSP